MAANVFVEKMEAPAYRLINSLGAAVVQDEFVVMDGKSLIVKDALASLDVGAFENAYGAIVQAGDYVPGQDTFAAAGLAVYFEPVTRKFSNTASAANYLVGHTIAAKSGTVIKFIACDPILIGADASTMAAAIAADEASIANITELAGRPFRKTVTLTAAAAGTPVSVVPAGEVGAVEKVYITDFDLSVGGGTAWTDSTGTGLTLQDTASSPVVAATFAKAQLTSQAQLGKHSAGVTLGTPLRTFAGLTAAKGLDLVGDSNFDAGSDITVQVSGFIA